MYTALLSFLFLSAAPEPKAEVSPSPEASAAAQAPKSFSDSEMVLRIGRKLRCPSCQGIPIVDSPSTVAQNMMNEVRRMVAEGKTEEEIMQHYASEWGEFLLLEPQRASAWFIPLVGFAFAFIGIILFLRRQRSASEGTAPAQGREQGTRRASDDPYLEAVQRELSQ